MIIDDFESICRDACAGVDKNGITSDSGNESAIDFESLSLRWQVCYALKFLKKKHGWTSTNKTKLPRSSYGWKHVVECQAKKAKDGFYICNGAIIVACRLAQIPEKSIHGLNASFVFESDLEIEIPHLRTGYKWTSEWKSKSAKQYASVALTCNLDEYFCNDLIFIIAEYLDIPFSMPPVFRFHARRYYNLLQPLAPQNQSTLF